MFPTSRELAGDSALGVRWTPEAEERGSAAGARLPAGQAAPAAAEGLCTHTSEATQLPCEPRFYDEETDPESLVNVSKVTQLMRG